MFFCASNIFPNYIFHKNMHCEIWVHSNGFDSFVTYLYLKFNVISVSISTIVQNMKYTSAETVQVSRFQREPRLFER